MIAISKVNTQQISWENRIKNLNLKKLPQHVALIMDGNGRWAKQRGLPRIAGHREGVKSVRAVIEAAQDIGVKSLTFYTFSKENWKRPKNEVSALWKLLVHSMNKEINDLIKNNVRVFTLGDLTPLPIEARNEMIRAMQLTEKNTGINFTLAINYSGRSELVNCFNKLIKQGVTEVSEDIITNALKIDKIPDPDLLIRTSGEMRISNFMLWQLAYTEIYVTDVHWPDFRKWEFLKAIEWFTTRERRFGKISEQLSK
ncbi:MAG: polyprenyl diphosphate synthase [bacterium]|nr:polyprenyl diphosphate synthase [bacterium]